MWGLGGSGEVGTYLFDKVADFAVVRVFARGRVYWTAPMGTSCFLLKLS